MWALFSNQLGLKERREGGGRKGRRGRGGEEGEGRKGRGGRGGEEGEGKEEVSH